MLKKTVVVLFAALAGCAQAPIALEKMGSFSCRRP